MGKIDRAALRQRIQTLEGLSDDERAALLQIVAEGRSYGLVWEDREEAVEERLRDELPVLVEDASLRIIGWDIEHELPRMDHELEDNNSREINGNSCENESPNHILIEGDNLEALTALSYTHEGRVDVIYIDPPYNTGNKDFVYNDSFVDSEDSYRHSKWLSFMSKRLRIAKRLLSDRGVIFISIDDNEQANLKLLCDQVFGEHNFIADMIWEQGKKHIGSFVGINHEYMLVYAKMKDYINDNQNKWHQKKEGLEKIYATYEKLKKQNKTDYESIEAGMKSFYDSLPESDPAYGSKHYCRVDERGIYFPDNISQGTGNGPRYDVIHPVTGKPVAKPAGGWRYAYDTMQKLLGENRIHFGEDETKIPCRKRYLTETEYELPCSVFYRDGRGATKELETILGKNLFDHPKDRNEIARILNFRQNDVILDFFAGSGTTLHAVMQLNKEDGGKRQCILVTNNENDICREVTYERNKRVIEGYTTPKGVPVEGLRNNNLRYYRTRLLPRERTNRNMRALVSAATDLLCIKENLFEELKDESLELREGLTQKDVRIFSDGKRAMMVVYNEEAIPDIVDWLQTAPATDALTQSNTNAIKVYVFSPGAYAWDDDFAPVLDRVELCALPEAIYQAYKNVLPQKRAQRSVEKPAQTKDKNILPTQNHDIR